MGIKLTHVHNLYETLLKSSKVCWNKWKNIFCPRLACLNITQVSVLSVWPLVQLCPTLCDPMWPHGAHRAPLSMGFTRQEYWSGLPCPPPGDLPNLGTEPRSPPVQGDSLSSSHHGSPRVCSLSLFQGVFPIQESNWGLLHCKRMLTSWATREVSSL